MPSEHEESPTPGSRIDPIGGVRGYIDAVRGFSRNARLFLAVTAIRGMVIASLQTVLNLYLYSLGYDARFIGLISAANSLAMLLCSFPAGYIADRIGRRPVLLIGGIAYPISITGLGLATTTPLIILFNFLFGVFAIAYWVAGIPLLYGSTEPQQRAQAFSINSFLLWGIGPLGAFLSGQTVEIAARVMQVSASSATALRAGMLFMAVLAFVDAIPYLFMRDEGRRSVHGEAPRLGRVAPLFVKLLTPDLVLSFGLGAVLTFIQLYFRLRFRLDPGPIGIIVGLGGTVAGGATLLTPIAVRRWGTLRTAIGCNWAVSPMIVVLAVAMQLVVALPAFWLVVALRGMNDPAYTAFVQESVPEDYRGRATGLYSVTYSIGAALGPAVSGQIQKIGGFTPAFLVGAVAYFLGSTLLYVFFARGAPRRSRVEASDAIAR